MYTTQIPGDVRTRIRANERTNAWMESSRVLNRLREANIITVNKIVTLLLTVPTTEERRVDEARY